MRYATTDRVVVAWLATLPGITPEMVDFQLPLNNSTWAASGFLTVLTVGGSRDVYAPLGHPIVNVKCWAANPDTGIAPWGKSNNLAEIIAAGAYSALGTQHTMDIPYCDQRGRVLSAYLVSEPRRMYGDTGDYACTSLDIAVHWAAS